MNYRNLNDMSALIRANIHRIPRVDVVAGIPRSGMIAASMIATLTDQPLANVNELLTQCWRPSAHGGRWKPTSQLPKTILLVDDSISGGETMHRTLTDLTHDNVIERIVTLAVYRKPNSPDMGMTLETVPGPRVFEWNWFRHPHIKKAVLDLDSVICTEEVKIKDWSDLAELRRIREAALPLYLPKYRVLALATGRREVERDVTEAWLAKHGVQYGKLYMTRAGFKAANTKAEAVFATKAEWMVESNDKQAASIRFSTNKPVLCTDTNTML